MDWPPTEATTGGVGRMNDFNLKFGSTGGAIVAALVALFGYLVFPYLLLTSLILMMNGLEVDENTWMAIFEDWRQLIFMLSIPLIILAFFRGYYWKGSYSRLSFALVMGAIFIFLVWGFNWTAGCSRLWTRRSWSCSSLPSSTSSSASRVFWTLYYVGEHVDERKEFVKRRDALLNLPPPMPENPGGPEQASVVA